MSAAQGPGRPVTPPLPPPDGAAAPAWVRRWRAPRLSLPHWARDQPDRAVLTSNHTGTREIYAWQVGASALRQVTDRQNGSHIGTIDPQGRRIWWFDDRDGDEFGIWRVQPWEGPAGSPDPEAAPGLTPAYSAGLALGLDGLAVIGRSRDQETAVHVIGTGVEPQEIYRHREDAHVGDLSRDDSLVVLSHSEHGDSRHMALRVLRLTDGTAVADLWDGPGKGLDPLGFAPMRDDQRLLVRHERRGRPELALWNPANGEVREIELALPGELAAEWSVDGRWLLVHHSHRGRAELYRYDLEGEVLAPVHTPPGVVAGATARPDGTIWYAWSSAASPPTLRLTGSSGPLVSAPGDPPPDAHPVEDVDAAGPGGTVHAFLTRPLAPAQPPYAAVFMVHGGPTWHDSDSWGPDVSGYADAGYAVVQVNYRGSTGYGSVWRDALEGRVGLTELEDIAAVREHLVAAGIVDPTRCVLEGGSWGGYLTLLGLGTQPGRWACGSAMVPVADYVAAYDDEMEGLQAFDRALFGGSPTDAPESYHQSSPLTYVDAVDVPVLVVAGVNDPRCPIRQIDNYLRALDGRGRPADVYRYDAGHGSLVVGERVRHLQVSLEFIGRHVQP